MYDLNALAQFSFTELERCINGDSTSPATTVVRFG